MSKWKCGICGSEFENFHAQGFNNKIYCPLCYFKKLTTDYKQRIDKAIEYLKDGYNESYDLRMEMLDKENVDELLSILKGEDKE